MIKVGLLFDAKNNWIEKYLIRINEIEELKKKYKFHFSYDPDEFKGYEIVFILGFTRILPKSFLESNKLNLVVHESELPKGKGFSPVQWQILEGGNRIAVCLFEAIEELDAGDIFAKVFIELGGYELFDEIRQKQAAATLELISKFLIEYPRNTRTKQHGESSVYRKRSEQDDALDIDKTIREQFNHLRIADNERYPLYFVIDGQKYYLIISNKKPV